MISKPEIKSISFVVQTKPHYEDLVTIPLDKIVLMYDTEGLYKDSEDEFDCCVVTLFLINNITCKIYTEDFDLPCDISNSLDKGIVEGTQFDNEIPKILKFEIIQ